MAINLFPDDYSPYTPGLGFQNQGIGLPNWGGGAGLGNANIGAPGGDGGGMFSLSSLIGSKDAPGWGGLALGAVGGLANAFFSKQQYDLAKRTLGENQRQFDLNYNAQRDTTNTALRDRQAARVASNPGAYQSVDDYMRENAIK